MSILATKVIEDNRLASYTEKSTRYQVYDKDTYLKPERLMASELGELYEETADYLMETYTELSGCMPEYFKKKNPQDKETPDALYNMRIKNMSCDACRYLLPVSVLTNLGMTANARVIEGAIIKLLTHPLEELQEMGEKIKRAALEVTPTLVKYTEYNDYLGRTLPALEALSQDKLKPGKSSSSQADVELVEHDKDAEDKLVAALLYRFSHKPYSEVKSKVRSLAQEEKEKVIDEALKRLGRFDRPLRELEHIYYTFDILVDYGAFRDIQRHRMATQTNQDITVEHGYSVPEAMVDAGYKRRFIECMDRAKMAFEKISERFPKEAQYIVPLAYNKRVLFTWNLRELFHFIKLRSGKTAHISYKRVAQKLYGCIKEKQPLLARYIVCSYD